MTEATLTQNAEVQTEQPSEQSEADRITDMMFPGSGDTEDGDTSPEEEQTQAAKEKAPTDGNPDDESRTAPDGEVPAEATASEEGKPDGTSEEKTPEELEAEANAKAEALRNDLLGIKPEDNTNDPAVLQKRYGDATRRIGELNDQLKSVNEVLASAGRQIVQTIDGPKIVATEDATAFDTAGFTATELYESLSQEEKDLFVDEPEKAAELIGEKLLKQVASKYAPVQGSSDERVLSEAEVDGVYNDFISEKLSDGTTPRFPDADNPEVTQLMADAYKANIPGMDAFKKLANQDANVHRILLDYLYHKSFRARHAMQSIRGAIKAATEEKKETNKKEVSVSSSGAGIAPAGTNVQTQNETPEQRAHRMVFGT